MKNKKIKALRNPIDNKIYSIQQESSYEEIFSLVATLVNRKYAEMCERGFINSKRQFLKEQDGD